MIDPILPKNKLEKRLIINLSTDSQLDIKQLKHQNPRAYLSLPSYWLSSSENNLDITSKKPPINDQGGITIDSIINSIPRSHFIYEKLIYENKQLISEILCLIKGQQVYIIYLQLLPPEFGLFYPLCERNFDQFYFDLLKITIERLKHFLKSNNAIEIVTDIYNPILFNQFVKLDFKKSIHQPFPNSTRVVKTL